MTDAMLSHADFAMHVDSVFLLEDGDLPVPLRLTEATALHAHPGAPTPRAPFELLFVAARQDVLPQSLYTLNHDAMGRLTIFLVPIGRDETGVTYNATFN